MLRMDFLTSTNQIRKAPTVVPVGVMYVPTAVVILKPIRLPIDINLHI